MRDADEKIIEAWIEQYQPIPNHIGEGGWIVNEVPIMFETYGDELEFVFNQPANNVWTWVDGDEGTFIVSGFSYVNRIGYFVTKEPWTKLEEFQVDYYDEEEDEDEDV